MDKQAVVHVHHETLLGSPKRHILATPQTTGMSPECMVQSEGTQDQKATTARVRSHDILEKAKLQGRGAT